MKNIDIYIDIDMASPENINIDKDILQNINIDIDIDKGILENIDIDIDIDKDILGKKSIFFSRNESFSCFFDEISISIVDISAFFEISMKYRHLF